MDMVIAVCCASWACLKLWSLMENLATRLLHHGPHSIIYSVKDLDLIVSLLGEYLSNVTNKSCCKEVECEQHYYEGHWIEHFVSFGPKAYAFRLTTGEIVCKVRGFSLNYKGSFAIYF